MPVEMNEYCRRERDNLVPIKLTVYKAIEAPQSISFAYYFCIRDIKNVTNVLIIESTLIFRGRSLMHQRKLLYDTQFKYHFHILNDS